MRSTVEQNFLKKRWVFGVSRERYTPHRAQRFSEYDVLTNPDMSEDLKRHLSAQVGSERLELRLSQPTINLYVVKHRQSNQLAAFYWSLYCKTGLKWHDKFPVTQGNALLFNAYVFPDHRRKGLYSALMATAHDHLLQTQRLERVFTVVEASNLASFKANQRFGLDIVAKNYLVKLLGKNILSIYLPLANASIDDKVRVHYVYRNARSRSF